MDYRSPGLAFQHQRQNSQLYNQQANSSSFPGSTPAAQFLDPQTRFNQPGVPHHSQYNGANGASGFPQQAPANSPATSGSMMQSPAAFAHQQQQQQQQQQLRAPPGHQQQQHQFFTPGAPPFSRGAQTPTAATAQEFATPTTKTFSPSIRQSPYGTPDLSHQRTPSATTSQFPSQMGTPAPSVQPATMASAAPQTPTINSMSQSPVSSNGPNREKERVALILEINAELLQELCNLQEQGKGGLPSQPQPGSQEAAAGMKQASKEYMEILRNLQANLSYLAATAEKHNKPSQALPPGPAWMSAPSCLPSLQEQYTKLQNLFPGWRGNPVKQSPVPQQRQSLPGQMPPQQQQHQQHGSFGGDSSEAHQHETATTA